MSCWVVPSLAAEIWRIPLTDVMQRIADGLLPVKQEDGFTFIDVAPESPRITGPGLPREKRPQTFTVVAAEPDPLSPGEAAALEEDDDRHVPIGEDAAPLGDWRVARQRAGRTRIAPRPQRLSA